MDRSGSGAGQQCFVYGRIRPVQPCMTLREGIVCHVPDGYIAARGGMLAKLAETGTGKGSPQIFQTMFLDADLTSSSYESCAPAQRQLKETLVQVPEVATSRSAGLLFASEERDKLLVENLRALKTCGFQAILLSGEFSDVVGSACCDAGLVLAGGIPARLLHALAADCGAEILRGLPDCFETFSEREAKRPIHLHLTHLSNSEHKRCFCYPVFGRRAISSTRRQWSSPWMVHFGSFGLGLMARMELKDQLRLHAQCFWKQAASPSCDKASQS